MTDKQLYVPIEEETTSPIQMLFKAPSKMLGQISFLRPTVPPPSMPPPPSPSLSELPSIPQEGSYNETEEENDVKHNSYQTNNYINDNNETLFGHERSSYQNIIVNTNPAPNVSGKRNNNPIPEIAHKLRIIILLALIITIGLELFSLLFKILNPTKFVMGIYLILLSTILLGVDAHVKKITKHLHDNVGLLYNGYGRSFYLLLLSSLCYASATCYYNVGIVIVILQYILCFIYFSCGCFTFYLRRVYKERLDDIYLVEGSNDEIKDIMANKFFWTDCSVNDETFSLLAETR